MFFHVCKISSFWIKLSEKTIGVYFIAYITVMRDIISGYFNEQQYLRYRGFTNYYISMISRGLALSAITATVSIGSIYLFTLIYSNVFYTQAYDISGFIRIWLFILMIYSFITMLGLALTFLTRDLTTGIIASIITNVILTSAQDQLFMERSVFRSSNVFFGGEFMGIIEYAILIIAVFTIGIVTCKRRDFIFNKYINN